MKNETFEPGTGQSLMPMPTCRSRAIQGALPIVARAIGRRMNIEVHIGGDKAKTDSRVIQLPTLPFNDPEVEALAFGYLEHEAAHIRYSKDVETKNALHHGLCNLIEDIRVERELTREFPGFGTNLARLASKLVQDGVFRAPDEANPMGIKLMDYLLYRLRAEVLQQKGLAEYAMQAEELFRQAFPAGACTRIGSVIGRVPALRSSDDACKLSGEILNILEEESKEPPPPPQPDQVGAADLQPGDGSSSEGASDAANSTLPAERVSPDPSAAARAALRELLNAAEPQLGQQLSETLSETLQNAAMEAVLQNGGMGGGFGRADSPTVSPPGNPKSILLEVHEASTALRTRLRTFVESVRYSRKGYTRQGTRLAPQRVVRAMLGDARIFEVKRPGRDVNTAIEVLCDRSGSMRGERMRIAALSTLAAASGISAIRGVALEAAVFPGHENDVELLTPFDAPLRSTVTRYADIRASGGTPMYEALMWGFERLLMRKEPRKILLCITDGEPPESSYKACQEAIEAARLGGIEVYAIGIKVPNIAALFPMSRPIENLSKLAPAIFGFLQSALTGRAAG